MGRIDLPEILVDIHHSLSPEAFDGEAATYDRAFTGAPTARWLRTRIHARLDARFRAGDSILELGCGTGEDALHLAERGVRVTATDVSAAMIEAARVKVGDHPLVMLARLDLRDLPVNGLRGPFDGAFSNFGPLNCLDDWRPLAAWLADRIKPGGVVGLGIMGPFCLWETAWHGLHGNPRVAFRRLRKDTSFQPGGAAAIPIRYPSPGRIRRDFAPRFRQVDLRGVGVFLPPSDVYGVIEKRPGLLKILMRLEMRLGHHRPFAWIGDHYWIELERGR